MQIVVANDRDSLVPPHPPDHLADEPQVQAMADQDHFDVLAVTPVVLLTSTLKRQIEHLLCAEVLRLFVTVLADREVRLDAHFFERHVGLPLIDEVRGTLAPTTP